MERNVRLRIAIGACLLIFCLQSGFLNLAASALSQKEVLGILLFLQTGRVVHFTAQTPTAPALPAATAPPPSPTRPTEPPIFPGEALELVDVQYFCDYRPDLDALLNKQLDFSLRADAPTVLIVHSHATEGYASAEGYRSLEAQENMVAIGAEVARVLQANGIQVLHDKTYHDHPDYDNSYGNARRTIRDYLEKYPSIQMVLDIHRDASDATSGQLITSATVGGQKSAQLMMVVGTDAGGNYHPDWRNNLSLALKLTGLLEQENPGICRPTALRTERFNMDLTAGSLLVEVGAAGNTLDEAKIAANALAQAIVKLADSA